MKENSYNATAPDSKDWPPLKLVAPPAKSDAMLAEDADGGTPTNGTDPIQKQLDEYNKWNTWLFEAGKLIQLVDGALDKYLTDKTAINDIDGGLRAVYKAVEDMNNDIVDAIVGLEKKPPVQPKVEFPPNKLPDWPDGDKPNIFSAAWGVIKPVLEDIDKKLVASHPGAPIVVALGGLIEAGDDMVKILKKYFPEDSPSSG